MIAEMLIAFGVGASIGCVFGGWLMLSYLKANPHMLFKVKP